MHRHVELRFPVSDDGDLITAVLVRPGRATALYAFAHGAGAGPWHSFMEQVALGLAQRGVATFRYHFPYMEAGRRFPDKQPVLLQTVRAAVAQAHHLAPDLPLVAGGKSMGGRMTSLAAAERPLDRVRGLAFIGFPLHPSGKPSVSRADHLSDVALPMLFLQGTRDKLAERGLLEPVVAAVRPTPTLHFVEGADHGFHVLKRSGRTDGEVLDELCECFVEWSSRLGEAPAD